MIDEAKIRVANLVVKKEQQAKKILLKISNAIHFAYSQNLIVNAGHGLNFNNIQYLQNKNLINALHIGHFVIFESIFESLDKVIKKLKKIIK